VLWNAPWRRNGGGSPERYIAVPEVSAEVPHAPVSRLRELQPQKLNLDRKRVEIAARRGLALAEAIVTLGARQTPSNGTELQEYSFELCLHVVVR
jgi:hypothetical protein